MIFADLPAVIPGFMPMAVIGAVVVITILGFMTSGETSSVGGNVMLGATIGGAICFFAVLTTNSNQANAYLIEAAESVYGVELTDEQAADLRGGFDGILGVHPERLQDGVDEGEDPDDYRFGTTEIDGVAVQLLFEDEEWILVDMDNDSAELERV